MPSTTAPIRKRPDPRLAPLPHSSWRLAVEPAPHAMTPVCSAGEFWERLGI